MRHKKLRLSAILLLWIGFIGLQAQESIPASGGDASGNGGTVSYTLGQVVYITIAGANGSVVQGVQQPYEISIVSGIKKARGINLEYAVYPNPTTDLFTLKIENYDNENLMYQLYDNNGKLFESKKLVDCNTTISIANLISSMYFLKVIDNQKEVKIFKIIKK